MQTLTLTNDDDIYHKDGIDFACSDASIDTVHNLVACSYAVVYSARSRYNFSSTIEGIEDTTAGESIGMREGIINYLLTIRPHPCPNKLLFICDNQNAKMRDHVGCFIFHKYLKYVHSFLLLHIRVGVSK